MIPTTFHGHTRHYGLFLDENIKRKLENVKHFLFVVVGQMDLQTCAIEPKCVTLYEMEIHDQTFEENSSQHCATVFINFSFFLFYLVTVTSLSFSINKSCFYISFHFCSIFNLFFLFSFTPKPSIPYAIYLLIHFNNFFAAP